MLWALNYTLIERALASKSELDGFKFRSKFTFTSLGLLTIHSLWGPQVLSSVKWGQIQYFAYISTFTVSNTNIECMKQMLVHSMDLITFRCHCFSIILLLYQKCLCIIYVLRTLLGRFKDSRKIALPRCLQSDIYAGSW